MGFLMVHTTGPRCDLAECRGQVTVSRVRWPPGGGVLSPLQGQGALSYVYTERPGVWLPSI